MARHSVGHDRQRIIQYAVMTTDAVVAPLAGRGMLVTGGSSGIGRAIALAAARAGADVAVTYRGNEAGARDTQREVERLGRRGTTWALDLTDGDAVTAFPSAVRDACGPLHAWINNAGA